MKQILLVEDEATIAQPLIDYLHSEGFHVYWAESLAAARTYKVSEIHLALVDWNLPDGRGIDLLRDWRADSKRLPVVILTARSDLVDKVLGLELGANDYVTKPFEPRELLARIHVQLRGLSSPKRAFPTSDEILEGADIRIDLSSRAVKHSGNPVDLTKMEFDLLKFFMKNCDRVFTREELLDRVWGYDSYPTTRTVDTHVLQLRQKTNSDAFETVRGVGYRFRLQPLTKSLPVDDNLT